MKKIISLGIAALLAVSALPVLSSCGGEGGEGYTYKSYTASLATNWNPHTWETNADSEIVGYLTSPLVDVSILDSEKGIYQWVYEAAESVSDVTAQNTADLTRFGCTLRNEKAQNVSAGYVFEIKLNKNAKWENGENITTEDYIESMKRLLAPEMKNYRANLYCSGESALAGAEEYYNGRSDFSSVGLYAADEYTLRYVTKNYISLDYFLSSCGSTWLVYTPLYDSLKQTSGDLVTTTYGTSPETTVSFGVYRLSSMQDQKQMVLLQNENWYGFTSEDGTLVSYTPFEIDGERRKQYQTQKIVIDVLDAPSAKQAFLRGELSVWTPTADELGTYSYSDRLYRSDTTYTMSFFFNTNADALRKMDQSRGNENSAVLSSTAFRRAMSLCIDRRELVSATPGYKSAYALMNSLYYYDVFDEDKNDGISGYETNYRNSNAAMAAICRLYGVEYGEGKRYQTLEQAYGSITGYNLTEAKKLMKEAAAELERKGIYKKGENVRVRVAFSAGALSSDDNKLITLLNKYLNSAAEGSGFGTITLEAVGNVENRYGAVPAGEYAIGYGAWGGAAFYPFRHFELYMDPDKYAVNEAACYNPEKDVLTLTVGGNDVSMTWQEWSRSMLGSGRYASASISDKLEICALLEEAFLSTYYRIPLYSTTEATLLSHQCDYYTDEYNIMYGFGGIRLMTYRYDDGEWASAVRDGVDYK